MDSKQTILITGDACFIDYMKTNIKKKKNLAVLISGTYRGSSLEGGCDRNFEESFTYFVKNDIDLNENYNINIFYATDCCVKQSYIDFFGESLKGYMKTDIENLDPPINLEEYLNIYYKHYEYRKSHPEKFIDVDEPRGNSHLYRFYKLYCAYQKMIEYEKRTNIKYDYIVRLRNDSHFVSSLYPILQIMEDDPKVQIQMYWDYGDVGRYDIMSHICKLFIVYGRYNYKEIIYNDCMGEVCRSMYGNYYDMDLYFLRGGWVESPEVQLYEHIMKYLTDHNIIDYSSAIKHTCFSKPIPH